MNTPTQDAVNAIKKIHQAKKAAEPVEVRMERIETAYKRLSKDYAAISCRLSRLSKSTGLGALLKNELEKRKVEK